MPFPANKTQRREPSSTAAPTAIAITSVEATPSHTWQQLLSQTINHPKDLLSALDLPSELLSAAQLADKSFALKVPAPYLSRIKKGDINDPLLKQVLPVEQELSSPEHFSQDPLEEKQSNPLQGLVHKYHGRVLLILSGACAINCRYCFRRHFPYQENQLGKPQWQAILDYIKNTPTITEVIFSGGDPLATSDARLASFISDLDQIPHLKRLRIHSRLPVVIPQRVTSELTHLLANSRLNTVMVLHINHAQEVDSQVVEAIKRLKSANIQVLNQAVLLKGVNDSVSTLVELSEVLFDSGVLPYYLFTLDPVAGASHFDIPDAQAIALHQAMQTQLPGYLVPRLAREIPGRASKTLLPDTLNPAAL